MIENRTSPPLGVWSICLLVLGGTLGGLHFFMPADVDNVSVKLNAFNFNLNTLRLNYVPDTSACQVIVWGSSLTRQGINLRPAFHEEILSRTGQEIEISKLIITGGSPEDLQYFENLFKVTKDMHPELLLIEDFLLLFSSVIKKAKKESIIKKNEYQRRKKILKKVAKLLIRPNYVSFDQFADKKGPSKLGDTTDLKRIPERELIRPEEYPELLYQLKKISENGIPIIVIDMPRPWAIQRVVKSERVEEGIKEQMETFAELGVPLIYWKYDRPMPFRMFKDQKGHMTEEGMKQYSAWLSARVTEYFSGRCN